MNHVTSTLAHSHWIPVAIFLATYILIAVESGRGSHLDRTAAAFCGAVAMVLAGAVPLTRGVPDDRLEHAHFSAGHDDPGGPFSGCRLFRLGGGARGAIARTRFQLLVLLVFTSGILSAFFVNDTICLIFTPDCAGGDRRLKVPPIPYLIAVATSVEYRVGDVCYRQSSECGGGHFGAFFVSGISGASRAGSVFWFGDQCRRARAFFPPARFLHHPLNRRVPSAAGEIRSRCCW